MNKKGFSIAEMMVVMLILSIVLAASMPIVTKRVSNSNGGGDSLWQTTSNGKDIYYGNDSSHRVSIGTNAIPSTDAMLTVNSFNPSQSIMSFFESGTPYGKLVVNSAGQVGLGKVTLANTYSTAIGYNACATGSGSVAIGCDSGGNGTSTTTNNQIKLGTVNHHVYVPGSEYIAGYTGIGTTTPYSPLELRALVSGSNGITLTAPVRNAPFLTWKLDSATAPLYSVRYDGGSGSLYFGLGDAATGHRSNIQFNKDGEIQSTSTGIGQFRAVNGNYGAILKNDGSDTYVLITNSGDPYGSWSSARPIRINNATGLCYINGTIPEGDAGHSFGTNGYQKFASGLIIQWGTASSGVVAFPIPFPNYCGSVTISTNRTGCGADGHNNVGNISTTSFYADFDPGPGWGHWMAVGY